MKFAFDITHPADMNFFIETIRRIAAAGHQVLLTTIQRGVLPELMRQTYPNLRLRVVGGYGRRPFELYWRCGILRQIELCRVLRAFRPDIALAIPGFQASVAGRLLAFETIGIYDDPEFRLDFELSRLLATRFVTPAAMTRSSLKGRAVERQPESPPKTSFFGLKEWAYLAPTYFRPDPQAVVRLGLVPFEYVFVRHVETCSRNYSQPAEISIQHLHDDQLIAGRVVLSLEDKSLAEGFGRWTILEEPVDGIHSLMYFSRAVISDGDSMAREGAQLGVDSFYCGSRTMVANRVLEEYGFLHHCRDVERLKRGLVRCRQRLSEESRRRRRRFLDETWDDPNDTIADVIAALVRPSARSGEESLYAAE